MIYLGLLLFFVTEYVRPTSYIPALLPLHLNSIVPLANFAGTLTTRGSQTLQRLSESGNSIIIGTLVLLCGISVLTADVTEYAYSGFMNLLGYAMAYVVLVGQVTTMRRLKGVIKVLILVHLTIAALNPVLFTDPEGRHYIASGSFIGDGNDLALSVNIVVPFALFLMTDSRKLIPRLIWMAALLVLTAGVVMTKSRGGTLALGVAAIAYFLTVERKAQTAVIGLLCLTLVLAFAPASYFERMRSMGDAQESSAAGRLQAWGAGIKMALDHPLLGVGVGHFGVRYGKEYHPDDARPGEKTAHSLYFLTLGELGLPGIIVVLSFFFTNIQANRRLAAEIRTRHPDGRRSELQLLYASTVSVIAFGVGGAFLSCLYYPHMYILGGILTATRALLAEQLSSSEVPAPAQAAQRPHLHWALQPPAATSSRRLRP